MEFDPLIDQVPLRRYQSHNISHHRAKLHNTTPHHAENPIIAEMRERRQQLRCPMAYKWGIRESKYKGKDFEPNGMPRLCACCESIMQEKRLFCGQLIVIREPSAFGRGSSVTCQVAPDIFLAIARSRWSVLEGKRELEFAVAHHTRRGNSQMESYKNFECRRQF